MNGALLIGLATLGVLLLGLAVTVVVHCIDDIKARKDVAVLLAERFTKLESRVGYLERGKE